MSLIDELRAAAPHIPPSHSPTATELMGVVGALITRLEHGGESFAAAAEKGFDGFAELFGPKPAPAEPVPAAVAGSAAVPPTAGAGPAPAGAPELTQLHSDIAELRSLVANLAGTLSTTRPAGQA